MLDLTPGEAFIVVFVTLAVVSARFWPRLGARLAERLSGAKLRGESAKGEDL
jgi:hypothetical protein